MVFSPSKVEGMMEGHGSTYITNMCIDIREVCKKNPPDLKSIIL